MQLISLSFIILIILSAQSFFLDQIEKRNCRTFFEHFEDYDMHATRLENKSEGKVEYVLLFLEEFGYVPGYLRTRILAGQDLNLLTNWIKRASKASFLAEFITVYLPELEES